MNDNIPRRPVAWLKPPRPLQSCGNCDAFSPNTAANPASGQPRQGWCRAQPPQMMQIMMPPNPLSGGGPVPGVQGMWPPTNTSSWCRGWQPEDDDNVAN